MNARTGGRWMLIGLLLLAPAGAASAVAATPAAMVAEDNVIRPFGWKGRESSLTVEDKVLLFAADAAPANGKGCVLSGVCI
jgi:hypothetical protein